jgi:phthalate 4,5-dioxygenase
VPLDDHHTMYWGWQVVGTNVGRGGATGNESNAGTGRPVNAAAPPNRAGFEYLPATSDWLGRFCLDQHKDNDYLIDREAQAKGESFTGIRGVRQQDKAVAESMGHVMDRTNEHLGTSDSMIIRSRRRMLGAVKAFMNEGATPPGIDQPDLYRHRSGSIILPRGADWLESTKHLRFPNVPIGEPAEPLTR